MECVSSLTQKILGIIIRTEYSLDELKGYDKHGNLVYRKLSHDYEAWYEYDKNGNMVHHIETTGNTFREEWFKYDTRGNMTYHKDSNGYEYWKRYDKHGRLVYSTDSDIRDCTFM